MERLDGWKNEPVRIAIAGPSVVGKSSFINVMLGKSKCDRAKVGIGNTTQERTFYYHPKNKGLQFWDLPGYGTPEFELNEEYLKSMRIEEYDFVLIMYSTVISSTDINFARKLMKANKMFAFVRTKADEFLDMKEKPFEQWCREAKTKCQNTLKDKGVSFENEKEQIFVISNKKPEKGDCDNLMNFLTENTVELKRMNILITLRRQTLPMIDEKEKQLLSRALKAAIAMGISTHLPIPDVDIGFNIVLLKHEITFYLEIFQLDKESLKEHSQFAVAKLKFCQEIIRDGIHKFIMHNIAKLAMVTTFSNVFEITIPILGGILNESISAARMYSFLRKVISKLADEARELNREQANDRVKRNC
ncbi:hypothetical protein FSP39_019924 [Pinctada imbricata]|uniref:IRG-type G domain-containing protein n=1 Tax=Pinctada imbricata TaxID=66713 RepID=A0AA89C713_PINIB|nr:hypothetical protein FSP39_019924 [Pinctada imbricata]